jgi:uncharacterized protein
MGAATISLETDALSPAEGRRAQLAAELDRFVPIIVERLHPAMILIFGSFASGHVGEWSDLDLVVVAESTLPFYQRLSEVFKAVRPRVGLDVLVYTPDEWENLKQTRRFVREEIVKKGTVIYERA